MTGLANDAGIRSFKYQMIKNDANIQNLKQSQTATTVTTTTAAAATTGPSSNSSQNSKIDSHGHKRD